MPARILNVAKTVLHTPIIKGVALRFVVRVAEEKVKETKNPYDDLAIDLVKAFLFGSQNIELTLKTFIHRMAKKPTSAQFWTILSFAISNYESQKNGQDASNRN